MLQAEQVLPVVPERGPELVVPEQESKPVAPEPELVVLEQAQEPW